ncbi:hypothetical protein KI688_002054 [Linnemannia hyalina]|uniref:Symplekin/Pta1 N-terminal domain-containing protein n=1 Tax=Linnemannia hyalina TaxID=64524 RepID=A0A9P7XT63_9FUNG|nr:hypothetical protein KI688_002054 [Linnemannia hyalina]
MLGLLPQDIVAILESEHHHHHNNNNNNNTRPDPARLCASLVKINTSTWLRLGAVCHNEGFAAEIRGLLPKAKSPTGHAPELTEQQQNEILYVENGMPRIVNTIQRHCRRDPQVIQDEPLLWRMYLVYREHMPKVDNEKRAHRIGGRVRTAAATTTTPPWQLEFMKSGCPEIMVLAFHDIFMEHGEWVGYETNIPKVLVEALDYEWSSGTSAAKRSVQGLIQVLQGCLRYRKTGDTETTTTPAARSVGLGVGDNRRFTQPSATQDRNSTPLDRELVKAIRQMTLILAEADSAFQVFLESEAGQNFPKLREAYLQELEGQKQKIGEKPVRKIGGLLGYTPSPDAGIAKKRVDILMGDDTPEGSPSIGSAGDDSPMTFTSPTWPASVLAAAARKEESKRPLNDGADSTAKKLRTASQLVEYATSGSWPDNNPTFSTHQTLTAPTARAQSQLNKMNNPLWSPILSLNFFPQAPNKYETQLESELERWISLCGRMDGAVFADKLVSLIKDVYPSDQKFLLEQILVEYMCWDETEGGERDYGEMAVYSSVSSGNVCQLTKPAPRIGFKSAEKAVDTIMGALVALVIKPEENLSHVVRKTHRWLEPIELVPSEESVDQKNEGVEDSSVKSAADAKGKKRKTRNLYNRRVSPFYAILSLFKPKRVEGRVTGMLYLTEQDIKDRTAERDSQESSAKSEFDVHIKKPRPNQRMLNTAAKAVPETPPQPVQPLPPAVPKFVYAPNVVPKGTLPPAVASKVAQSTVVVPKVVHPPAVTSRAAIPPPVVTPEVAPPPVEVPKVVESGIVPAVEPVAMPDLDALDEPLSPKAPKPAGTVSSAYPGVGPTDPTYFSPELMLHLGPEVMEGIVEPSLVDRALLSKPQAKRLKRMRQKHTKLKKAAEDLGEIYVPVMTGQFPGAEIFFDQLDIQLDTGPPAPKSASRDKAASAPVVSSESADVDMDAPPQDKGDAVASRVQSVMEERSVHGEEEKEEDDGNDKNDDDEENEQRGGPPVGEPVVKVGIESEDVEMSESKGFDEQEHSGSGFKEVTEMSEDIKSLDEQQHSEPEPKGVDADGDQVMPDSGLTESSVNLKEEHDEDMVPRMVEELPLKENLRLAKQAESMRMECHAPFRVLLRILQYLTKANQGVMLDLWIIESLSDTVEPLQVIYFEWMLRELIDTSPRPSMLPLKIDQDESIQLEEEILRLIPLLLAAPTIGRGPAVSAFKAVERSLKGHTIPRLGTETDPDNRSYWERAQELLGL